MGSIMSKRLSIGIERNKTQHVSRGEGKADGIPRNPKAGVAVTAKKPPAGQGKTPAPKPKDTKADGIPRNPKAG